MTARRLAAVAFLLGGLLPLGGVAPAACAAEGAHAVLVVDTEAPGGQFRYCVAMPDNSVTGIELIELASEQHGLQYRLGYGGNVVCQLAGVGYSSDECLKEGPQFWGYWRGDGSGGWEWSSSGGQATTVRHGDVEGWAWGTGTDGSTHPAPPETTFASVCGEPSGGRDRDKDAAKDESASKRERSGRRGSARSGPAAAPAAEQEAAAKQPQKKHERAGTDKGRDGPRARRSKDARHARPRRASPSPSLSPAHAPAAIASEPTSSGGRPPVGGVIAAAAALALLGTGILLRRRRARMG